MWSCSHKYSVMKQTELPKKTTTWGEGGQFIEHLTVHIWSCHCTEIMAESAIIILHLPAHCMWVVVFEVGWVLLNLAGCMGVISQCLGGSCPHWCRWLCSIWCWMWRCYTSVHGLRHWCIGSMRSWIWCRGLGHSTRNGK